MTMLNAADPQYCVKYASVRFRAVGPSAPHRAAFAHGVIDGRTAQEFEPNGKAALEIDQLYKWICGVVGMPTRRHVRKAA